MINPSNFQYRLNNSSLGTWLDNMVNDIRELQLYRDTRFFPILFGELMNILNSSAVDFSQDPTICLSSMYGGELSVPMVWISDDLAGENAEDPVDLSMTQVGCGVEQWYVSRPFIISSTRAASGFVITDSSFVRDINRMINPERYIDDAAVGGMGCIGTVNYWTMPSASSATGVSDVSSIKIATSGAGAATIMGLFGSGSTKFTDESVFCQLELRFICG